MQACASLLVQGAVCTIGAGGSAHDHNSWTRPAFMCVNVGAIAGFALAEHASSAHTCCSWPQLPGYPSHVLSPVSLYSPKSSPLECT